MDEQKEEFAADADRAATMLYTWVFSSSEEHYRAVREIVPTAYCDGYAQAQIDFPGAAEDFHLALARDTARVALKDYFTEVAEREYNATQTVTGVFVHFMLEEIEWFELLDRVQDSLMEGVVPVYYSLDSFDRRRAAHIVFTTEQEQISE